MPAYYSLIQFYPDASRDERVNIGVLLFRDEPHFLAAAMDPNNARALRFFPDADPGHLTTLKDTFADSVETARPYITSVHDLQLQAAHLANETRLTEPRWVACEGPDATLAELYRELVEEPRPPSEGPLLPLRAP